MSEPNPNYSTQLLDAQNDLLLLRKARQMTGLAGEVVELLGKQHSPPALTIECNARQCAHNDGRGFCGLPGGVSLAVSDGAVYCPDYVVPAGEAVSGVFELKCPLADCDFNESDSCDFINGANVYKKQDGEMSCGAYAPEIDAEPIAAALEDVARAAGCWKDDETPPPGAFMIDNREPTEAEARRGMELDD